MISESWPWKQELVAIAERLQGFKASCHLSDEDLFQIERDILIGFYAVRKLCETVTKLTDATKSMQFQLSWYRNLEPVNWRNNHKIDELYDLNVCHQETRDVGFVSNQLIHSFLFAPCVGKNGGLSEIWFTSDTKKDEKLYSIRVEDVIQAFQQVGTDDPTEVHWMRHPGGGETTTVC